MNWADALRERVDRDRLVAGWLLPGATVIGAMAVGFVLVAAVLLTSEPLITGALWRELLALATMFLFPHLVAGLWFGRRHEPALGPPIAAGLAPIVVLMLAFAANGGPVLTPFLLPLATLGSVVVWAATFATGMVAGERLTST